MQLRGNICEIQRLPIPLRRRGGWAVLCCVTGCVCADMLVNMERKKKRKKNMNKNSFADTLFMFVASRGSTWVATVRVSTGFQPNKMLHSTWEGGRVGVGCACMSACGQGWKRPGRRFAWRLKRRTFTEESRGRKKEWEWKDTIESALLC